MTVRVESNPDFSREHDARGDVGAQAPPPERLNDGFVLEEKDELSFRG